MSNQVVELFPELLTHHEAHDEATRAHLPSVSMQVLARGGTAYYVGFRDSCNQLARDLRCAFVRSPIHPAIARALTKETNYLEFPHC